VTILSLTVLDPEPAEVDRLARGLYGELGALDVDDLRLVHAEEPPSAKGDPATVTALLVALATSPVLVQLGTVLRAWVTRDAARRLLIRDGDRSIELTGATADENAEAIREFFHRDIE
jgi:hypothetical protein